MPRYRYVCIECEEHQVVFHSFEENSKAQCKVCGSNRYMEKLVSIPLHFKSQNEYTEAKVGDLTKEYIEKNREILEEEKQKAKEKTHEQT